MSHAVGRALGRYAGTPPYVITADLVKQFGLEGRMHELPKLTYDVGVGEQAMIGIASGLSSLGRPVVCTTFAAFMMRGLEVWRNSILLDDRHVILVGGHAGLSAGANGATHHAVEDTEVFGSFPGVRVFSPCDEIELDRMLAFAIDEPGQYYISVSRSIPPHVPDPDVKQAQRWMKLLEAGPTGRGPDCIVVSHGSIWHLVVEAARASAARDPSLRIVAIYTGDLTHESLPPGLRCSRLVHVAETTIYSRTARLASAAIQHDNFVSMGASWPSSSDDHDVLLQAAGLDVSNLCQAILGGRDVL